MSDPARSQEPALTPHLLLDMDGELRTLLDRVIGMVELVLDARLTAQQRQDLKRAQASADELLSAVNNLVSVARIDAGAFDIDPIPFSLRDSLGYTLGALALRVRDRNIKVVSHILSQVPDELVGDPVVLRQILGSIIEHLGRRPGSGVIILRVEQAWRTGETVELEFSVTRHDTGRAAAPARGPSPLLAIATRLIDAAGGRIDPARGGASHDAVQFSLGFRLQTEPAASPVPAGGAAMRNLSVLLAGAEPTHRYLLHAMVAGWGMRAVVVDEAPQALAALERAARAGKPFQLMLVDSGVPGMDGLQLAAEMRTRPALSATRIMLLVRAGRRGDAALCRRLGIAAYLTRPLKRADMFDAILTVLGMPPGQDPLFLITRHSLRESARPLRVLLLSVRPGERARLTKVLEEDGHTVLSARTRPDAAAALRHQPIDIVFAEARWSGLDPEGLVKLLEPGEDADRPVCVAMASSWTAAGRRRALAAGLRACLTRPIRPAQLRRIIDEFRGSGHGGA
jgi:CheY-like chemotaxis protein